MKTWAILAVLLTATTAHAQYWGEPSKECRQQGMLTLSSILWGIPWGQSWAEACQNTPAAFAGDRTPDRCPQTAFNQWGEWDMAGGCDTYRVYRVCDGITCTQRACALSDGDVFHSTYVCPFFLGPLCDSTSLAESTVQFFIDPPGSQVGSNEGCFTF